MTFAQNPPLETGVSQTLARWRAANYSDVRYRLNITLEKGTSLMTGEIQISVKLTDEGAKNDLILDWRTTQFQNDKDQPFAKVFTVNNLPENSAQAKNEHLIIPKKSLKSGENIIRIQFASPIKTSGSAITRYVDKEDGAEYVYSLFVPSDASTAFPVFDQPDLKARFQLVATISRGWKIVANTTQGRVTPITRRIGHVGKNSETVSTPLDYIEFPETKPISTYVFAFAAGDFAEFEDEVEKNRLGVEGCFPGDPSDPSDALVPYGRKTPKIYVRKSQAEKFKAHEKEVFRLNREGVKFLETYFDYKFPFPKYDLVLIPEFPFGGMEHAGATFLKESSVIFPTEPTKNDYVSRANVIFHEAAHQWFGDTVTMKWFDDLWLKEGFAEFMAYKTLEKVMPEYNAWKIFYERNKQAAYLTDSTRGTTPIYQEITNLSAAKSAYGNIVYRKAPSFLKQAEFFLGADKFQTAVRSFLKKHEFSNAEWSDLIKEFEKTSDYDKEQLKRWSEKWVTKPGLPIITFGKNKDGDLLCNPIHNKYFCYYGQINISNQKDEWWMKTKILVIHDNGEKDVVDSSLAKSKPYDELEAFDGTVVIPVGWNTQFIFPNYQDYGYGIFLLDEKSRAYVLANIQTEKDDFLRAMMWGSLWDSVRETELAPADYVRLVVKNINVETDESTIQTLLGRISTAMNYYLNDKQRDELAPQVEALLIDKIQNAPTLGLRITYYRAFLNIVSSEKARNILKQILSEDLGEKGGNTKMRPGVAKIGGKTVYAANPAIPLKTKDKFDIVTKLLVLGDKDAPQILAELEKTETSDEAKRYAYAAKAGIATAENKAKFWKDFTENKEISESWIEAAFVPFNSIRHSELTLPYLEKALAELPNLKKNRKIFFVNGWLGAFIGGQKSEAALKIVNKFLNDNPNLDKDLRLKILENSDNLERAVKIRAEYGK